MVYLWLLVSHTWCELSVGRECNEKQVVPTRVDVKVLHSPVSYSQRRVGHLLLAAIQNVSGCGRPCLLEVQVRIPVRQFERPCGQTAKTVPLWLVRTPGLVPWPENIGERDTWQCVAVGIGEGEAVEELRVKGGAGEWGGGGGEGGYTDRGHGGRWDRREARRSSRPGQAAGAGKGHG